MTARDILTVLQVGFSGFAAVMAVLAFRLIHLQIKRDRIHASSARTLRDFTRYTLFLSIIVILSTIVERGFDFATRRLDSTAHLTSVAAQDCREALQSIVGPEAESGSPEKIQTLLKLTYNSCQAVIRDIEGAP